MSGDKQHGNQWESAADVTNSSEVFNGLEGLNSGWRI